MIFGLTRVERSLFYPARVDRYQMRSNNPVPLYFVNRQSPIFIVQSNRLLPSERAALSQPCLATGGLAPAYSLASVLNRCRWKSTYRTCEQPWQTTTVLACEKTVVMVKHPGHLTSMKKERGAGTRVLSLCLRASLRWSISIYVCGECSEKAARTRQE